MFRRRKRQSATTTLLGPETRVQGDIEFKGGLHVDGYVCGNVESVGEEPGTLSISERGCVEGGVAAQHIRLNGTVKGDVKASERVELGPRARVIGNVQYKLIEMAVGAEVNGKLIHESERQAPEAGHSRPAEAREPAAPANLVGE